MGNDQLQVLNALDVAKTQWYHFTAIIIAGMGFFTDAYDLFCISLVTKLLGRIYYQVDGVVFVGTLVGQLFFGWLGDKMGRKRVYGLTLMLMVICAQDFPLVPIHIHFVSFHFGLVLVSVAIILF
ncbi:hypothetical protein IC582_007923 [Cucumis melo]